MSDVRNSLSDTQDLGDLTQRESTKQSGSRVNPLRYDPASSPPQNSRRKKLLFIGAFLAVGAVLVGAFVASTQSPSPADDHSQTSQDFQYSGETRKKSKATLSASTSPSPSPSASPSPSKSASGNSNRYSAGSGPRPGLPVPAGFPTFDNTGWKHTGVSLTPTDERVYAETPGQVFDSMDFRNGIVVTADNVTIKRSRVQCGDCPGIWVDWDVKNTLIEDVEVTSKSKGERIDRGITAGRTYDLTIRRAQVHDTQRGIEYGYSVTIEDSYVDDAYNPTPAHSSAIGGDSSANSKIIIRRNWIAQKPEQNNSGALLLYPGGEEQTQNVDVLIEGNILNGGTYALWLSSDTRWHGSITVRDNIFDTKYFDTCGGYNTHFTDEIEKVPTINFTWDNNVWRAPGQAKDGKQIAHIITY